MKSFAIFASLLLLLTSTKLNTSTELMHQSGETHPVSLRGKVFRSDTGESVPNAYLIIQERESQAEHFDLRTDEHGQFVFRDIPAGRYTAAIYAWFAAMKDVPCQNNSTGQTGNGKVKVEWQWKSQAYMESAKVSGISIDGKGEQVKDFDLACE